MGDRTRCTLKLAGLLTSQHLSELMEIMDNEMGTAYDDEYNEIEDLKQAIQDGLSSIEFEEMNYARMPDDLVDLCHKAGLKYVWEWEPGGDYGSGMEIYDPFKDQMQSYKACESEILLTLNEAEDPAQVAEAKSWQSIAEIQGLAVCNSNHEALKLRAENEIDPRFFELRDKATLALPA
jgi:hypothetical protein